MSDGNPPVPPLVERDAGRSCAWIDPPAGVRAPLPIDIGTVAALIAGDQYDSGEIPWRRGEKTDPWDHVEAAMGLTIGGYHAQARRAFDWLADRQLPDGSWYAGYRRGRPMDRTRDSNLCAYVAVGVYHHYLATGDLEFIHRLWPTVAAAMGFALSLQAPDGQVFWALSPQGQVDRMALVTGCSSIHMSLKCALVLARLLNHPQPTWQRAMDRLAQAVRCRPHLFNQTKARFSMDWFYPVLSGIITGPAARQRIADQWDKFVVAGHGVRCVSDQPWITLAETSELTLTLAAIGGNGPGPGGLRLDLRQEICRRLLLVRVHLPRYDHLAGGQNDLDQCGGAAGRRCPLGPDPGRGPFQT